MIALLLGIPVAAQTQAPAPLDVKDKLVFHLKASYGPGILVGIAAIAGADELLKPKKEWAPEPAYGLRIAEIAAVSGTRGALAFGLDSALHEDPRYFRLGGKGFFRRTGHAVRGTILTRTDSGGETLSLWRIGGDYGSAFITNTWFPDRVNTARSGFVEGSIIMALDLATQIWVRSSGPDIKSKVFHRK